MNESCRVSTTTGSALSLTPTESVLVKKGFHRSRRKWLISLARNRDFLLVKGNTFGLVMAYCSMLMACGQNHYKKKPRRRSIRTGRKRVRGESYCLSCTGLARILAVLQPFCMRQIPPCSSTFSPGFPN